MVDRRAAENDAGRELGLRLWRHNPVHKLQLRVEAPSARPYVRSEQLAELSGEQWRDLTADLDTDLATALADQVVDEIGPHVLEGRTRNQIFLECDATETGTSCREFK